MKRIAIISAFAGFGALAAQAGEDPAAKFAEMDVDASGVVSEAEFVSYATVDGEWSVEDARVKFQAAAGDDGELTLEEAQAAWAAKDDAGYGDDTGDKADDGSATNEGGY